ncbi:DUF72 domain-containing protein [Microbacterium rhizosphaerae]|uniref:DUF72 domain-containing protein n=1 Tax=Microbacterium rhizosphaerae TaxID=1678237 RepID=A0ABZ0SN14_9MICO|nr:DUF72 domain-containing protein [Microbacterium rhizosphaerae]WPR88636.1 DUF72 domain-containing protein [Microbacterium rhizosphaerae]
MAHIGTSGWSYEHWEEALYHGVATGRRLQVYAQEFDTVELNASFYRWPSDARFAAWRDQLPAGFEVAVKAPRGLSHSRRLRDPAEWISRIERGLRALSDRRGPLLVQLPPTMERDDDRLDVFLSMLAGWTRPAVEFRHASWNDEDVFAILERHGTAYCIMSGAGLPTVLRVTGALVYARLHGPDQERLYRGSYSDDELREWARRIREWEAAGHDVYVYFDNDEAGHAVRNARTLIAMLAG